MSCFKLSEGKQNVRVLYMKGTHEPRCVLPNLGGEELFPLKWCCLCGSICQYIIPLCIQRKAKVCVSKWICFVACRFTSLCGRSSTCITFHRYLGYSLSVLIPIFVGVKGQGAGKGKTDVAVELNSKFINATSNHAWYLNHWPVWML